jgi:hypothetical protein
MAGTDKNFIAPSACVLTNADATLMCNNYKPTTADDTFWTYKLALNSSVVSSIDTSNVTVTYSNSCDFNSGNSTEPPTQLTDGTEFEILTVGAQLIMQSFNYPTQAGLLSSAAINPPSTGCLLYLEFDVNLVSGGTSHIKVVLKRATLCSSQQSELIIT